MTCCVIQLESIVIPLGRMHFHCDRRFSTELIRNRRNAPKKALMFAQTNNLHHYINADMAENIFKLVRI